MATISPIVLTHLQTHDIRFRAFNCDPGFADTAAFCEKYGFKPEKSANTIIIVGKSDPPSYAACPVLAHTKLDVNKTVRQLMGVRRASFASNEQTTALTGMMVGGVTLFGLPPDLPIYVDSRVMDCPEIVLGGGNRSSKILMAPEELKKIPGVKIINDLAMGQKTE